MLMSALTPTVHVKQRAIISRAMVALEFFVRSTLVYQNRFSYAHHIVTGNRIPSHRARGHALLPRDWINAMRTKNTMDPTQMHQQHLSPQQHYVFPISTMLHCHSAVPIRIVFGYDPLNYSGTLATTEAQSDHPNVKPTQVALDSQASFENLTNSIFDKTVFRCFHPSQYWAEEIRNGAAT